MTTMDERSIVARDDLTTMADLVGWAPLDPHAGGFSKFRATDALDALGVISAGHKPKAAEGKTAYPLPSRDGIIYVSGDPMRCQGLIDHLRAREMQSALIAFPYDNPRQFIRQSFRRYTASRLEAWGDEERLTFIQIVREANGKQPAEIRRITVYAGTPEYARLAATCKSYFRIHFQLAEWDERGPAFVFPDGMGWYAIRTTSLHTVRNLQAALIYAASLNRGSFRGIPFETRLTYPEVAGPDGRKRTIPTFAFTVRPPAGANGEVVRLDAAQWRALTDGARNQASMLALPAPEPESWDRAALEGPLVADEDQPDDLAFAQMQRGGTCDAEAARRRFFATTDGTYYDTAEARAEFMTAFTDGAHTSLATYLAVATEADATRLQMAIQAAVAERRTPEEKAELAARYAELFTPDEENDASNGPSET